MYLVSLYFDDKTNKIIQNYINKVAEKTGNMFMLDGNVPPHITVSAFETKREVECIAMVENIVTQIKTGKIQWVSVGTFFPYVIYITPVLNDYLQGMIEVIYEQMQTIPETKMSPYYKPFGWLPHTTIGKKLSEEELREAFAVMQSQFRVVEGTVTKIGLAKTNPYCEIKTWELK